MPDKSKLSSTQQSLCDSVRAQLLIVDIQEKLGSAMPNKVLNRVVENSALLLQAANALQIPVIASEQYPRGLGPTVQQVATHLPPNTGRIEKTAFSCVGADGFMELLDRERRQVIIAGMEAHVCVIQTAMDLAARGFEPYVIEDAICSRRLENYQNALARMLRSNIPVVSAESVVFEWLRDASHPQFKTLSKLLR
jgi:isochorismate hydrolase